MSPPGGSGTVLLLPAKSHTKGKVCHLKKKNYSSALFHFNRQTSNGKPLHADSRGILAWSLQLAEVMGAHNYVYVVTWWCYICLENLSCWLSGSKQPCRESRMSKSCRQPARSWSLSPTTVRNWTLPRPQGLGSRSFHIRLSDETTAPAEILNVAL